MSRHATSIRWWIELLERAYPEQWSAILATGNTHPPMCLRVNRRRCSSHAYRDKLQARGIAARALGEETLLLEAPVADGAPTRIR